MQTENIFIVHPTHEQESALKAFIKALKIKFEVAKSDEVYDLDFVAKIKKSKQESKEGKITRVKKEDLQSFLGL